MNFAPWFFAQIVRRRPPAPSPSWIGWIGDSRNGVFLVLALALFFGGGRKWLQAIRARRAVDRLDGERPDLEAIAEAANHGRSAVVELFRLLGSAHDGLIRDAAGRALAVLWKEDQLIPEEEQALVTRGFVATWKARRRYPRALVRPIPIAIEFGVPFLTDGERGVGPGSLEWSYRVLGTDRVSLETFGPWRAGPGRAEFALDPTDFGPDGPHRLVLHARVRTTGLTTPWEREMPKVPFSFEFDPLLAPDALLTLPDEARAAEMAAAVSLNFLAPEMSGASENAAPSESAFEGTEDDDLALDDEARRGPVSKLKAIAVCPSELDAPGYLPLNADFAVREPPALEVRGPLPCDLAHTLFLEVEGWPRLLPAGEVVHLAARSRPAEEDVVRFPLVLSESLPAEAIDRPGDRRVRAVLTVDPHRAWAHPEVRSVWPGSIETGWITVRVVRQ